MQYIAEEKLQNVGGRKNHQQQNWNDIYIH